MWLGRLARLASGQQCRVPKVRKPELDVASAEPKEVAAAVALSGAAALGGKLAWDTVSARRRRTIERARAYRLAPDEPVPDGMRRIARGQLDAGIDELERQPDGGLDAAVHSTRKRLKRLRAELRLGRPAIGGTTYRRENAAFRELGRKLSGPRDAMVLVETLDGLTDRFRDELPPSTTAVLRGRLVEAHERAVAELLGDAAMIDGVRSGLEEARLRSASWTFAADGFEALGGGLGRIYKRGRRAMRAAADDPTTERLHEWRKRSKDLWHALQIVRPAGPKRTKRLARRAHGLADLLGDDHDLAVLRERVRRSRGAFESDAASDALLAAIDRRRRTLQSQALELGAVVYGRAPKRFVRSIERGWQKRATAAARPTAG
jgi:CHAD domain-containing protein